MARNFSGFFWFAVLLFILSVSHRVSRLRELRERERQRNEEVKYHLLTQWTSGLQTIYTQFC